MLQNSKTEGIGGIGFTQSVLHPMHIPEQSHNCSLNPRFISQSLGTRMVWVASLRPALFISPHSGGRPRLQIQREATSRSTPDSAERIRLTTSFFHFFDYLRFIHFKTSPSPWFGQSARLIQDHPRVMLKINENHTLGTSKPPSDCKRLCKNAGNSGVMTLTGFTRLYGSHLSHTGPKKGTRNLLRSICGSHTHVNGKKPGEYTRKI